MFFPYSYALLAIFLTAGSGSDWQEYSAQLLTARMELEQAQNQLTSQRQLHLQQQQNLLMEIEQQKLLLNKALWQKKAQEKQLAAAQLAYDTLLTTNRQQQEAVQAVIEQLTAMLTGACFPQEIVSRLQHISQLLNQNEILPHEATYMLAALLQELKQQDSRSSRHEELVTLPDKSQKLLPVISMGQTLHYVKNSNGYALFYQQEGQCHYWPITNPEEEHLLQALFQQTENGQSLQPEALVLP